jgi:lipoyl synthase
MQQFLNAPLSDLQQKAFRIRKEIFGDELTFAIPGVVSYHSDRVSPRTPFAAISITGKACRLQCEHCKGKLLETMLPAASPKALRSTLDRLQSNGGSGALISGGADENGEVPLKEFIPAIRAMKEKQPGFRIIAHTGLIGVENALALKEAGIDQILIDMIGDDDTIREVYHLNRHTDDYERTLLMLKEMGHSVAPHIIIGHHFGKIRGEWKALEMVSRIGVDALVFVIFKPITGVRPDETPTPDAASRLCAAARILNPRTPIRMGCIRPAHPSKPVMERGFVDSGVNTIAYPLQGTIDYAEEIGLEIKFVERCCSLA